MGTGEWIVIGLCAFVFVWFVAGTSFNQRINETQARLYRQALSCYGEFGAARRLDPSSTSFSLIEPAASSPFTRLEATLCLERRENLPLWLIQRLRGRRDVLILKAALRQAPRGEFHSLPAKDEELKQTLLGPQKKPLVFTQSVGALSLYQRGPLGEDRLADLTAWVHRYQSASARLSLQPELPHLTCSLTLKSLQATPLETVLKDLLASLS